MPKENPNIAPFKQLREAIRAEERRTNQKAVRVRVSKNLASDLVGMDHDDWFAAILTADPVIEVAENSSAPPVEIIDGTKETETETGQGTLALGRRELIQVATTPLGFFVLTLLVVEAVAGEKWANGGWAKASQYGCEYLLRAGFLRRKISEVEVTKKGVKFLKSVKRYDRSTLE